MCLKINSEVVELTLLAILRRGRVFHPRHCSVCLCISECSLVLGVSRIVCPLPSRQFRDYLSLPPPPLVSDATPLHSCPPTPLYSTRPFPPFPADAITISNSCPTAPLLLGGRPTDRRAAPAHRLQGENPLASSSPSLLAYLEGLFLPSLLPSLLPSSSPIHSLNLQLFGNPRAPPNRNRRRRHRHRL